MKIWIGESFEKTIDGDRMLVVDVIPTAEKPSEKNYNNLIYKWV
ncbi:hypothetical protein [Fictibacillus macauensis]|nr:hypothetical protein [Fictibacillus macauensis]